MKPRLEGKKVAVLIESDFYEPEIHYYQRRFPEEGAEIHFLTNLWGLHNCLLFLGALSLLTGSLWITYRRKSALL